MIRSDTRPGQPSARDLWSSPVAVADIPETGLRRELEADPAIRARIAAAAGLRDVSRLQARFNLAPMSDERVHVSGHVSAVVGQNCVVTLEPLDSPIEEAVDVIFSAAVPEEPRPSAEEDDPHRHASWDIEPPEPIIDGRIDLGALATEFMILGINPYPRKEGAAFAPVKEASDPESHPFAALARLKTPKADDAG